MNRSNLTYYAWTSVRSYDGKNADVQICGYYQIGHFSLQSSGWQWVCCRNMAARPSVGVLPRTIGTGGVRGGWSLSQVLSDQLNLVYHYQLGQIMATRLILAPFPPFRIFRPSYGLATNLYVFSCNINDNIIMIKDGSSRSVYERAKHSNQWSQILFEAAYISLSRDIWLKTKMSLLKLRSCLDR